jgi:release factor glutamine methyltransferase
MLQSSPGGPLIDAMTTLLSRCADAEAPRAEAALIVSYIADVPLSLVPSALDSFDSSRVAACLRAAATRATGAPLAYAVGQVAFRHLTLFVDERVLIPRPETEVLVEEVLNLPIAPGGVAIDVGTGSGAIALSLAQEGAFASVLGIDVSLDALAVARMNHAKLVQSLRTPVELLQGTLLAPARGLRARVIVSNPPYIAYGERESLPGSVRDHEPAVALFSGEDGLAATRALINSAPEYLEEGGWLALESDSTRAQAVARILSEDGRWVDVKVRPDLAGRDRVVLARMITGGRPSSIGP